MSTLYSSMGLKKLEIFVFVLKGMGIIFELSRLHGLLLNFGGIAFDRNITAYCISLIAINRNHIIVLYYDL